MSDPSPTNSVPVPGPPPTPWAVEPSAETVELTAGTAEVTFTVKNQLATRQRAVFEMVPGDAVAPAWFTIDGERQRPVEPNQSTQFKVTVTAPAGTPAATYSFQARVYAADTAPEESSTLSNRVTFAVAATAPPPPFPWWIIAVVAAVVLVLAVIGYLVVSKDEEPAVLTTTTAAPDLPEAVPEVTGQTQDQAIATLAAAGYPNVDPIRVQSTDIRPGLSLGTDPTAGTEADPTGTITLRMAVDLAAPELVAPAEATNLAAGTTSVPLVWTAVPEAARYRLTVVAPACSTVGETPSTTTPPVTTVPPPPPPVTEPLMIPDVTLVRREDLQIYLPPGAILQVCGFAASAPTATTKLDVDATSFDLTVGIRGGAGLVQWSVNALDDQGNEGPSSLVRQFAYVP